MLRGIWPNQPFDRGVAMFFALVLLALGIATINNAPLCYDGAFYLFQILDTHQFTFFSGRVIHVPLQVPVLIATRLTQNIVVLRLVYSAAYASIPVLGLAASWLVCKSRRPSLFIWPAISICIADLPGQFFFQAESIMAVTLLWPVLLALLVSSPAAVWPLVAITSITASRSHPNAIVVLAFIVFVAIVSAIVRPESRKASLGFALALGTLLLARIFAGLSPYETNALAVNTIVMSLNDSVIGWPLVATALAMVAALSCLLSVRSRARIYLMVPLLLAGVALVAWASKPLNWANCMDFRFWVTPVSLTLMAGASVEELWLRSSTESRLQDIRRYAVPLVGTIFLVVLSIQSVQWGLMSQRLTKDLMDSDQGCVSRDSLGWLEYTALRHWSVTLYAVNLQGRRPRRLLLPHETACVIFAHTGEALLVEEGAFKLFRFRGEGWFDFAQARSSPGTTK